MEIKGTAVKSTPEYIKEKYPTRYLEWLQSMPESSRKIFEQFIYATSWYNLIDSVIIPTQKAGDLFFNGNHAEAAHGLGRHSANIALKGIYKIFVRVSSPHYVLSRASSIFSTYYKPSSISVTESKNKRCVLELSKFKYSERLIMHRIAGWIEQTLEITLKTALTVDIHNQLSGKSLKTLITVEWD
jgi:ribosomal protein S17E